MMIVLIDQLMCAVAYEVRKVIKFLKSILTTRFDLVIAVHLNFRIECAFHNVGALVSVFRIVAGAVRFHDISAIWIVHAGPQPFQ